MNEQAAPIVIIGFGPQAQSWAMNLKDSRRPVCIALRKNSPSFSMARERGFETITLGPELGRYQKFALLTSDSAHLEILQTYEPFFPENSLIILAHGQSFVKDSLGEQFPRLHFSLLAPKAIASEVRRQFQIKGKLGACFSPEGVHSPFVAEYKTFVLALAKDLGITAGPYEVSFKEEAYMDIFSEQSLLCSLLPYGALYSYNKLREKGHSPEAAYMECWTELKLIAETMVSLGPLNFFELISPTALAGSEKARHRFFDEEYFAKLENLYKDVASGDFFRQLDQTPFTDTKKDVIDFWKKQELVQTHEKMKSIL